MDPTIIGGFSEERPANEDIQKIVDKVKVSVEEQSGRKFAEFKAIAYRSEVVAGMNYIIKVCVGDGKHDYIILRVYENLQQEVTLISYKLDKTKDDPINPIEVPN